MMIVPAQLIGGIAAAGLAKSLTLGHFGKVYYRAYTRTKRAETYLKGVETTLAPGVSNAQGLFIGTANPLAPGLAGSDSLDVRQRCSRRRYYASPY